MQETKESLCCGASTIEPLYPEAAAVPRSVKDAGYKLSSARPNTLVMRQYPSRYSGSLCCIQQMHACTRTEPVKHTYGCGR